MTQMSASPLHPNPLPLLPPRALLFLALPTQPLCGTLTRDFNHMMLVVRRMHQKVF